MRSALFGLLCMAVLNVWGDVVSQTDLEYIEGRYCLRGTQQPYSGVAEVYHENGQLARRSEYLNGQLHGADNAWYADGLPQYRLRHLLGVPQGFGSVWYAPAARNLPTSSMRCSSPNAVSEICDGPGLLDSVVESNQVQLMRCNSADAIAELCSKTASSEASQLEFCSDC